MATSTTSCSSTEEESASASVSTSDPAPPQCEADDDNSTNREEDEYRRRCRHFYRISTSVAEDDVADLAEAYDDEEAATNGQNKKKDPHSKVVLEAVDKLSQQQLLNAASGENKDESYTTFLNDLTPEQLLVLQACGLPTNTSTTTDDLPPKLERLVQIRTEERKLAHEINMRERQTILQQILNDLVEKQNSDETAINPYKPVSNSFLTSKQQVTSIKTTLRQFCHTYAASCVASHSLLAGMRQCIEVQLDDDEAPCVEWTFDAAVISEAIVAQQGGGSAQYMRDACQALLSFLVFSHDNQKENTTSSVLQFTFSMDPSWSDKTLTQILQVLPRPHELHGRPTGKLVTPLKGGMVRTNVEGEGDEPMDVCALIVKSLKNRGWWF